MTQTQALTKTLVFPLDVVEWIQRFDSPVIVFEDLKDMRDDIEYGTRMNRRLHLCRFEYLKPAESR